MSQTLFKTTFKRNWLLAVIFTGVLIMYLSSMMSMYDPKSMNAYKDMLKLLPESFINALGMGNISSDLTGYLASSLYGMLMIGFPMVYCIILGNRLVAKMTDSGSMAYLLSTPDSRVKIIITQGIYALLSVVIMFTIIFGIGFVACSQKFPGLLDIGGFLRVNFITMLVNMTVMMITFFFSCLFNDSVKSIGFGSALPIASILLNMLGNSSKDARILRNISIYGLYDPSKIASGGQMLIPCLVYFVTIAVLFTAGVIVFKRKNLPL